jgi:diadenosine tetraphosphate (Ap4A) HIT family hydrolase/predicted kinase
MSPLLVSLRGMPGIGKTALARAVARQLGWPVLDKDDIKEVVYGRTPVADELSYDLLFRLAQRQLRQGLNVVVDSPLMNSGLYALASRTAVEASATLVVLDCVLSDAAEHRRRIELRAASRPERAWAIQDWAGFVAYRDRVRLGSDFGIDVPHRVIDLGQNEAVAAHEAATWVRGLMPGGSWMPRERWDALVRGEDCPLCAAIGSDEAENAYSFKVADLRISQVRLSREQHVPGWCHVICRRHVREPHELALAERRDFFDDMLGVGEALERVYRAQKINYQILGNLVPHLHAHVQPRLYGDAYPGQPVSGPPGQPVFLTADEYRKRIGTIRTALGV